MFGDQVARTEGKNILPGHYLIPPPCPGESDLGAKEASTSTSSSGMEIDHRGGFCFSHLTSCLICDLLFLSLSWGSASIHTMRGGKLWHTNLQNMQL